MNGVYKRGRKWGVCDDVDVLTVSSLTLQEGVVVAKNRMVALRAALLQLPWK